MLGEVSEVLAGMEGGKIMLPTDVAVGDAFSAEAERTIVPASDIPEGSVGLDIGPETVERFTSILHNAENVFWNGPMGVFEWEPYRLGTAGIAAAIASSPGFTVVGGGRQRRRFTHPGSGGRRLASVDWRRGRVGIPRGTSAAGPRGVGKVGE